MARLRVRVYHSYYGCDSGCCGHVVEVDGDGARKSYFEFTHPWGETDRLAWAKDLAEKTISEHWPGCLESIDWSSLTVDDVGDC